MTIPNWWRRTLTTLLMGLAELPLLLVLPLAVVHYPANRRITGRSDFHQIQPSFAGHTHRSKTLYNANLVILVIYQAYCFSLYASVHL